jgi:hypothetical protein
MIWPWTPFFNRLARLRLPAVRRELGYGMVLSGACALLGYAACLFTREVAT